MVSHVPLLLLLCTAGYVCSVRAGEDSAKPRDATETSNDKGQPLAKTSSTYENVDVPLLTRLRRHLKTNSCNECQQQPHYPSGGGGGGGGDGGGTALAVATYNNWGGGGGGGGGGSHPGCNTCG